MRHLPLRSVGVLVLWGVIVHTARAVDAINPLQVDDIWTLLTVVLDAVILLIFPVVVLMLVFTGFLFVTAQGNESKLTKARQALVWTIVGALVVLGSKALALAIEATVEDIKAGVYEYTASHTA